ncbi:hypothetical protein N7G274_001886 [Stereocaulon virgatum]|uniref:Uncharacterized protein n=1 Tax=Stereocaulon virgatum TaxID=373712 RepID=A0ABR4AKZ9_9LECA
MSSSHQSDPEGTPPLSPAIPPTTREDHVQNNFRTKPKLRWLCGPDFDPPTSTASASTSIPLSTKPPVDHTLLPRERTTQWAQSPIGQDGQPIPQLPDNAAHKLLREINSIKPGQEDVNSNDCMHALSVSEYSMESALDLLIERLGFEGHSKKSMVREAMKG